MSERERGYMKRGNTLILLSLCIGIMLLLVPPDLHAGSFMDKVTDPRDGKLDVSDWLLHHKGFLPVPIVITEPAVGFGGGVALLFFHKSLDESIVELQTESDEQSSDGKKRRLLPPSISGAWGLITENNTWSVGGMHFGSWKKDRVRYIGALGKISVNLKYYGRAEGSFLKNGLDYNLDGWFLLHELMFRQAASDFFVGGKLVYFNATNTFDFGDNPLGIERWELDFKNVGLGFVLEYDSRDNIFTPNHGINTDISVMFYKGEGLGNLTRDYQITDAKNLWYWEMLPDLIMGWRLEGNLSSGNVPFYALPYINLRGIPFNRYQGSYVLQTELEGRYQLSERWGLVPFVGVGTTADEVNEFGESDARWAGGMGFRYLVARKMRIFSGIDIARGPEDWAIYFQVGSGL